MTRARSSTTVLCHIARAAAALALLASRPTAASAQDALRPWADIPDRVRATVAWPTSSACFDAMPSSALRRVVVYAQAWPDDRPMPVATAAGLRLSFDALLQSVADRARAMLGAKGDELPRGEPTLGDTLHAWHGVGAGLEVIAYRDGRIMWRPEPERDDTAGAALLARALADAHAAGEYVVWPADPASASVGSAGFTIRLAWPTVDSRGKAHPLEKGHPAVAVFSLAMPWEEPVKVVRAVTPAYPETARSESYEGKVLMQFVVDTTGRADPSTIREIIPRGTARPGGFDGSVYDQFVQAARRSVARSRFAPSRVGGCPVRQLVQMPYDWKLR